MIIRLPHQFVSTTPWPRMFAVIFPELVFLLMVPGFFLFQRAVSLGEMESYDGYVGIVCVTSLPVLLLSYFLALKSRRYSFFVDTLFFFNIVFMLIWITIQRLYATEPGSIKLVFNGLVIWITYYFLGRTLPLESNSVKWISYVSLGVIFLVVFSNLEGAVFLLGSGSSQATYQYFGFSLVLASAICMAHTKQTYSLWIVATLTFFALIFNGARSELIAFVFTTSFILLMGPKRLPYLAVLTLVVIALTSQLDILERYEKNRIGNLIFYGAEGTQIERSAATDAAIKAIVRNPIHGDFTSYPPGEYAHNILSAWVDFGLAGFILLLCLIIIPSSLIFRRMSAFKVSPFFRMSVGLFISTAALMFFSKYLLYPLFSFALGVMAQQFQNRQRF